MGLGGLKRVIGCFVAFWIAILLIGGYALMCFVGAIPKPPDNKVFIVAHEDIAKVRANIAKWRLLYDCGEQPDGTSLDTFQRLASSNHFVQISDCVLVSVDIDAYTNQIELSNYAFTAFNFYGAGRIGDCEYDNSSIPNQRMVIKRFTETILKGVPYKSKTSDFQDTLVYINRPIVLYGLGALVLLPISLIIFLAYLAICAFTGKYGIPKK